MILDVMHHDVTEVSLPTFGKMKLSHKVVAIQEARSDEKIALENLAKGKLKTVTLAD